MSVKTRTRFHSFEVTNTQTILADDIRRIIIGERPNKIAAIRLIRATYPPIGLKDAKEIYEAVEADNERGN